MADDFSMGLHPDPQDISRKLRSQGIVPQNLITQRTVDPWIVGHLEGYVAEGDERRAREIASRHDTLMPILVAERSDGSLEVISGAHRLKAAHLMGENIGALIVPERAIGLVFKPYGGVAMHRWAHHVAGTRWNPGVEV